MKHKKNLFEWDCAHADTYVYSLCARVRPLVGYELFGNRAVRFLLLDVNVATQVTRHARCALGADRRYARGRRLAYHQSPIQPSIKFDAGRPGSRVTR